MNTRSSRSVMTFHNAFNLPGFFDELPAGDYEIVVEEELLQGLSFEAWRRIATYLTVRGQRGFAGGTRLRPTTEGDLERALIRDRASMRNDTDSEAALSPQEDLK